MPRARRLLILSTTAALALGACGGRGAPPPATVLGDDAITVAEHGADYVAFGEFDDPSPAAAAIDLTEWWGEIMTVPCVGAGCANARDATRLAAAGADFIAIGTGLWPALAERLREIATAWSGVRT